MEEMGCECKNYDDGSWYINDPGFNNPSFRRPVQVYDNCAFIAALSSVVWVTNNIITNVRSTVINGIRHWPAKLYYATVVYQIPQTFYLDLSAPQPFCQGHSNKPGELWVPIYERAYGYSLTGNPDQCDFSGITWPSAGACLPRLTGWSPVPLTIPIPAGADPASIYNDLKSRCNGDEPECNKDEREWNGQKTIKPTVAWTRSTAPLGTDQMRPDHAYSVLGVYYNCDDKKKYVVLRNPKCKSEGTSNRNVLIAGDWGNQVDDLLYNKSGVSVGGVGLHGINFDASIGIFALNINQFVQYFSGYAWVG